MNLRGWVAVAESPDWFAWPNDAGRKDKQNSMFDRCRRQGFVANESGKFKVDTFHWYELYSHFEFPAIDDARPLFPIEFILERLD